MEVEHTIPLVYIGDAMSSLVLGSCRTVTLNSLLHLRMPRLSNASPKPLACHSYARSMRHSTAGGQSLGGFCILAATQERAYVTGLSAANLVVQRLGEGRTAAILDTVGYKAYKAPCLAADHSNHSLCPGVLEEMDQALVCFKDCASKAHAWCLKEWLAPWYASRNSACPAPRHLIGHISWFASRMPWHLAGHEKWILALQSQR